MGSIIGVLSTVILVSTVCTLIFAVGAYVLARRNRDGVNIMVDGGIPGEDVIEKEFPHRGDSEMPSGTESTLFKRLQPNAGSQPVNAKVEMSTNGNSAARREAATPREVSLDVGADQSCTCGRGVAVPSSDR